MKEVTSPGGTEDVPRRPAIDGAGASILSLSLERWNSRDPPEEAFLSVTAPVGLVDESQLFS